MRVKYIDYSTEAINKLLELTPPEQCDVQRQKDEDKEWNAEKWGELLLTLYGEGAKWHVAWMLLKSDFKSVPKAWASFVVQTLEGTSCSAEIPRRVPTIPTILDCAPINVGELISNNIYEFASKSFRSVAHSKPNMLVVRGSRCGLVLQQFGCFNDEADY